MRQNISPEQYGPGPQINVPGLQGAQPAMPVQSMRMDVGPSLRESLSYISPEEAWFSDNFAASNKNRGALDTIMKGAQFGQGASELSKYADAEDMAREAYKMANESLNMSDDEFKQLIGQLGTETGNQPQVPGPAKPQMPNDLQLGVTGLAALLTPEHGFDILSTPFKSATEQAAKKDAQNMLRYSAEEKAHQERLRLANTKLDLWEVRRRNAESKADRAFRMMKDIGDDAKAEEQFWIGKFYGANTEAEVDHAARVLQGAGSKHAPTPEEVRTQKENVGAARKRLEDAAAEALRQKARTDLEQQIRSHNENVNQARSAYGGVLPDDMRQQFEAEDATLKAAILSSGFPNMPFPAPLSNAPTLSKTNSDRTAAEQAKEREYQHNRDKIQDEHWQKTWDATHGEAKSLKDKQKQVGEADKQIKSAREKIDQLSLSPVTPHPDDPSKDEEDAVKRENEKQDLITKEWWHWQKKQEIANGVPFPTSEEDRRAARDKYAAEHYPDTSFWDRVGSAMQGNVDSGAGKKPANQSKARKSEKSTPKASKGFDKLKQAGWR